MKLLPKIIECSAEEVAAMNASIRAAARLTAAIAEYHAAQDEVDRLAAESHKLPA